MAWEMLNAKTRLALVYSMLMDQEQTRFSLEMTRPGSNELQKCIDTCNRLTAEKVALEAKIPEAERPPKPEPPTTVNPLPAR